MGMPSRVGQPACQPVSERVEVPRARMIPLAPQKFGSQFTGDQETHDAYERVRNLLSHEVPTGGCSRLRPRCGPM